jgi:hypothetical protein
MKLRYLIGALLVALFLVPSALAQGGSAEQGYGGEGGNVQTGVSAGGDAAAGGLPFTGLDLALLVIGGLTLLLVGAGLRRAARARN